MTTELEFAKRFLNALDSRPIQVPSDWMADLKTLQPPIPYTLPRMPKPMQKPAATTSTTTEASSTSSTGLTIALRSTRNPPLDLRLPSQDPNTTSILSLKQRVASELGLPGTEKVRILFRKKPCSDAKTVKELLAAAGGDGGDGASGVAAATAAEQSEVEFGVMVIGGVPAGATPTTASASAKTDAEGDTAMAGSPASPPAAVAAAAAVAATATTSTTQKETPSSAKGETTTAPSPVPAIGASGREVLDKDKEFWSDLEGFLQQRVKDADVAAQARKLFEAAWREGSK